MNKRVLFAALAGAVTNFLLGWVIYGMMLMDYMKANSIQYPGLMKEPPNLLLIFLSGLFWAWAYAYIFDRWAGIKDFKSGMMAGIMITIPFCLSVDLQMSALMNQYTSYMPMIADVLASTVMGSIMGGVVGLILGMGNKSSEAA